MSCDRLGCLMGALDLREFAGQAVLAFGGDAVTLPAWDTAEGEGLFFDPIDGLNGRGRALGLPNDAATKWTASGAAGALDLRFDPATRHLHFDGGQLFTVKPSVDNTSFGIPAAGLPAGVSATATLPYEWDFTTSVGLVIAPSGFPDFTVVADTWIDTLTVAMRERGNGDADDKAPTDCLEQLCNDQVDASVRVGLDDEGHVVIAYASTLTDPTWSSTAFRNALGFTGTETPEVSGDVTVLRAARDLPKVQMLRDGWVLDVGGKYAGSAVETPQTMDGSPEGTREMLHVSFGLYGPGHAQNDHAHFLRRARPESVGLPFSFYPHGPTETRRALDPYDVTADQLAEDLLYTDVRKGYGGRFPARLALEQAEEQRIEFNSAAAIRSIPVEVILAVDEVG